MSKELLEHDWDDILMENKMTNTCFAEIKELEQGKPIDEKGIEELCVFIDRRLDCADFRMVTILRTYIKYSHLLSEKILKKMKHTILNFKYWIDEPGDDSICYWSENHQILFFASAYIAGGLFPEETFCSGKKGLEMKELFTNRITQWMRYRFDHGFTEWHSNTYYEEDIPALTLFIDFDDRFSKSATIILDLFVADMAMHNYKGLFSVTSGRCYEAAKRNPISQDTLHIQEHLFGRRYLDELDYTKISSNLFLCSYEVPEVLVDIANDTSTSVVKTSMGHNLDELASLRPKYGDEAIDYLQWAMEAFSNHEIIANTLRMYNEYDLKKNVFLKDFEMLNKPFLRPFVGPISKILSPYTDGVAIQKVNSYTYRTDSYILSNAQNYHPKMFGDQQHIWQLTIDSELSIFTTHPGGSAFDDNARNFSPSYWVGNGINPDSYQHENILLCCYDLRKRKGFMEQDRVEFSHLHFPSDKFDEVVVKDKYIFGRKGEVCVGIISKETLEYDDIEAIQRGRVTSWVCEVAVEDFSEFMTRIEKNSVTFDDNNIKYSNLEMTFNKSFKVDGNKVNTNYKRLESKYGSYDRCSEKVVYEFNGKRLTLDLSRGERKYEANV